MKKIIIAALLLVILGAGGYFTFLAQGAPLLRKEDAAPAQPTIVSSAPDSPSTEVEALGRLVPAKYSEIQFRTSGIIQEIMVKEGQEVKKGDVLARLRDEQQMKLAVSQAKLEIMNAEKALADLELNAPLQAAQAYYDMTQVEKEIDKIKKRRNAMEYPRATQDEIDDAYEAYKQADDAFEQVADYFKATDDAYKAAKTQRNTTLSAYNWLISKYSDLEKRETEADLLLNERKLSDLERLYNIYSKGPNPDDVALAEARIEVAKEQLAVAEASFEDLTLHAPFSGVIVRLDLQEGQIIAASQPFLLLADLSHWNIETEDLTELNITEINEGAEARIAIDAIPNKTFQGTVVDIKEIGETQRGDITYTVIIELAENDPRLRWNMTSPITIETE